MDERLPALADQLLQIEREFSLWQLIAQAREAQGDASGAALARQKAQVGT